LETLPTPSRPLYRVGTLTYTRGALFEVMFWMLWGDFFFYLFESVTPALMPLQLRWEGASDSMIGFLTSPNAIFALCFYPVIGMQSDRHRGRLGRRRPFLLWCTPPVVLSLVLLGAAKPSGAVLYRVIHALGFSTGLTLAGCTIAWITVCSVVFIIFNSYVQQIYLYLFVDVIPKEVMGRFIALYRVLGAAGGFAFNHWILGHAKSHTLYICVLCGLLYAAAFYMIIWRVKEGEYPPPPPRRPGNRLAGARRYLAECYTHPFYLTYFSVSFFFWASLVPMGSFLVFFATQAGQPGYAPTLGLSLTEYGNVKSWTGLMQIPAFFLIGPLIDRFHAIRVSLVGLLLASVTFFLCYALIRDGRSMMLWLGLNQAANAIFLGAGAALMPLLLPRERYGQFVSANQTLGYSSIIVGPPLCGILMGALRNYRWIFVFSGVCTTVSFLVLVSVYVQWRRLGGARHFTPPDTRRDIPDTHPC